MTTVAHKFIDLLKQDNILEAIDVIKQELTKQALVVSEDIKKEVAESFKLQPISEKEEGDDEKDDEEDNEDDDEE